LSKTESFALEEAGIDEMQAALLDAQYRKHPDLVKMSLYGVVLSFKDSFVTWRLGMPIDRIDMDFKNI
jgi:hypothetical protein